MGGNSSSNKQRNKCKLNPPTVLAVAWFVCGKRQGVIDSAMAFNCVFDLFFLLRETFGSDIIVSEAVLHVQNHSESSL